MPYETRVLETGTIFSPEDDGVWTMGDWEGNGTQDLIFIKTGRKRCCDPGAGNFDDTGTKTVEVHVASGASKYQEAAWHSGSVFPLDQDGTWLMADFTGDKKLDLILITNNHSNLVEVKVASGASGYRDLVYNRATIFLPTNDGTWTMADTTGTGKLDLCLIRTHGTASGQVEVHVATRESDYQQMRFKSKTIFKNECVDKCVAGGTWLLTPFDLKNPSVPDLVYIKTSMNNLKTVEVLVAGATTNYQRRIFSAETTFGVPEAYRTWCMAKYTPDAEHPDLVFIKALDTGTGRVEVHIASYQ